MRATRLGRGHGREEMGGAADWALEKTSGQVGVRDSPWGGKGLPGEIKDVLWGSSSAELWFLQLLDLSPWGSCKGSMEVALQM